MKLSIIFCAIIGLSAASLHDDLNDITSLIPVSKIKEIAVKYQNDPDIASIIEYLKSPDFAAVAKTITGSPECRDLIKYLHSKYINILDPINYIADLLGLPHLDLTDLDNSRMKRSLRNFLDEIKAVLPIDDIAAVVLDKLTNSEDFQELYAKIAAVDYQKLKDDALSRPEIVDLIQRLKNIGVDVDNLWELVKSVFGWEMKQ